MTTTTGPGDGVAGLLLRDRRLVGLRLGLRRHVAAALDQILDHVLGLALLKVVAQLLDLARGRGRPVEQPDGC